MSECSSILAQLQTKPPKFANYRIDNVKKLESPYFGPKEVGQVWSEYESALSQKDKELWNSCSQVLVLPKDIFLRQVHLWFGEEEYRQNYTFRTISDKEVILGRHQDVRDYPRAPAFTMSAHGPVLFHSDDDVDHILFVHRKRDDGVTYVEGTLFAESVTYKEGKIAGAGGVRSAGESIERAWFREAHEEMFGCSKEMKEAVSHCTYYPALLRQFKDDMMVIGVGHISSNVSLEKWIQESVVKPSSEVLAVYVVKLSDYAGAPPAQDKMDTDEERKDAVVRKIDHAGCVKDGETTLDQFKAKLSTEVKAALDKYLKGELVCTFQPSGKSDIDLWFDVMPTMH